MAKRNKQKTGKQSSKRADKEREERATELMSNSVYAIRVLSEMHRTGTYGQHSVVDMIGYARNGFSDNPNKFEGDVLAKLRGAKVIEPVYKEDSLAGFELTKKEKQMALTSEAEGLLKLMEPEREYTAHELMHLALQRNPMRFGQEVLSPAKTFGMLEQTSRKPAGYTLTDRVQQYLA
mgnify:CR=1 FL=1